MLFGTERSISFYFNPTNAFNQAIEKAIQGAQNQLSKNIQVIRDTAFQAIRSTKSNAQELAKKIPLLNSICKKFSCTTKQEKLVRKIKKAIERKKISKKNGLTAIEKKCPPKIRNIHPKLSWFSEENGIFARELGRALRLPSFGGVDLNTNKLQPPQCQKPIKYFIRSNVCHGQAIPNPTSGNHTLEKTTLLQTNIEERSQADLSNWLTYETYFIASDLENGNFNPLILDTALDCIAEGYGIEAFTQTASKTKNPELSVVLFKKLISKGHAIKEARITALKLYGLGHTKSADELSSYLPTPIGRIEKVMAISNDFIKKTQKEMLRKKSRNQLPRTLKVFIQATAYSFLTTFLSYQYIAYGPLISQNLAITT